MQNHPANEGNIIYPGFRKFPSQLHFKNHTKYLKLAQKNVGTGKEQLLVFKAFPLRKQEFRIGFLESISLCSVCISYDVQQT